MTHDHFQEIATREHAEYRRSTRIGGLLIVAVLATLLAMILAIRSVGLAW